MPQITISASHAEALDQVSEITGMYRHRVVAWLLETALEGGPGPLAAAIAAAGLGFGAIFGRPAHAGEVVGEVAE